MTRYRSSYALTDPRRNRKSHSNQNADFGDRPGDDGRRRWRKFHPIIPPPTKPVEPPKPIVYTAQTQPYTVIQFSDAPSKETLDALARYAESSERGPLYRNRTSPCVIIVKGRIERLFIEYAVQRYRWVIFDHLIGPSELPFKLQRRKPYPIPPKKTAL